MRKLFTALTLSLLSCASMAQQIYQWTDERGTVQYGQLPPADSQYRSLDIKAAPPPGGQLRTPATPPTASATTAEEQTATEQRRTARAEAEQRAATCQTLREQLQTLLDNPRLRRTNEAGEVERIGEDERQELIRTTREGVQEHCQG
ncbi:DUF4124 domain-containing protein [Pseudomonas sp. MYb185]|uniref:DUF4124 domain-containing protein n=1 Tax=Pseudomonas sp. MYb185 TaxID=1848729 RepID=UPI000CFE2ACE|nr:DUF4124 domain-containing protein [Pseudomonas sp. MYb185]PRB79841.1 hypothetical protein CQ007_14615 [Pseudomonas sp. MYb185]